MIFSEETLIIVNSYRMVSIGVIGLLHFRKVSISAGRDINSKTDLLSTA